MGIVNVTPDSFSDGGAARRHAAALAHCERLLERRRRHPRHRRRVDAGRAAPPVPSRRSWRASLPVLRSALAPRRAGVGRHHQGRGDARRARPRARTSSTTSTRCAAPGALEAVAAHPTCGVCLMHMQGDAAIDAGGAALRRRGRRGGARSCASGSRGATARASRASGSSSIPASASARRWRTTSSCWRASARCSRSACRCSPAGRASRRSAPSPGGAGRRAHWRGQRGRARWRRGRSAAPASCACTTSPRRSTRLAVWQAAGADDSATVQRTGRTLDEQNVFRHRRHPRHGRRGADHARLHAAARPRRRPGAARRAKRAPDAC